MRVSGGFPKSPDSQIEGEKVGNESGWDVNKEREVQRKMEDRRERRNIRREKFNKKREKTPSLSKNPPRPVDNGTGGEQVWDGVFSRVAVEARRDRRDREAVLMTHAARGGKGVVDEGEVVKTLRTRDGAGNGGEGVGDVIDGGGGERCGGKRVG